MATRRRGGPGGGGVGVAFPRPDRGVLGLIIANAVCFALYAIAARSPLAPWVNELLLVPRDTVFGFRLWQPFTYMFLHSLSGTGHLVMNMLFLWIFGTQVESMIGTKRFIKSYIWCGLAGALLTIVVAGLGALLLGTDNEVGAMWRIPTLGASGAVLGITFVWAGALWNQTTNFLFLGQMKVKTFAIIIAIIELLGALSFDGASWTAHFGGMGLGYLIGRGQFPPRNLKKWWTKRKHEKTRKRLQRFDVIDGGKQDDTAGPPIWGGRGNDNGPTVH